MRWMLVVTLLVVGCGEAARFAADGAMDDVCSKAYAKLKGCAYGLQCSILDAGRSRTACEAARAATAYPDYPAAIAACERATPGKCACTGDNKTAADRILRSGLDWYTCQTPDGPPHRPVDFDLPAG